MRTRKAWLHCGDAYPAFSPVEAHYNSNASSSTQPIVWHMAGVPCPYWEILTGFYSSWKQPSAKVLTGFGCKLDTDVTFSETNKESETSTFSPTTSEQPLSHHQRCETGGRASMDRYAPLPRQRGVTEVTTHRLLVCDANTKSALNSTAHKHPGLNHLDVPKIIYINALPSYNNNELFL